MSKLILSDSFDRANTSSGLGSDWTTVAAGGGAQTVIQNGTAEFRSYPTAGLHLVSAFYTGQGRTNLIAETQVTAYLAPSPTQPAPGWPGFPFVPTSPVVDLGDYEYTFGLLSGYILPVDWALLSGNVVAGYGLAYDTASQVASVFYQLANGSQQVAAAQLFTWNAGETKTFKIRTTNDAITDPTDPYYGTLTDGQPRLIRLRFWIDDTEIVGNLPIQLYAPSLANPLAPGSIPGRSTGTYDGMFVVTSYGSPLSSPVRAGGFVQFDNFKKNDLTTRAEPAPVCTPRPTLTNITVNTDEVTSATTLPASLAPDRVYTGEYVYQPIKFETEIGDAISYTQDAGGRRITTWTWTGLTETQKDALEAILESAAETRGGISFYDPDFATTDVWQLADESYEITLLAAGLFSASVQVIGARS